VFFRSVNFFIALNVELSRPIELGPQLTNETLRTEVLIVSDGKDIDLSVVSQQLLSKLDDFDRHGSEGQGGSEGQVSLIKNCALSAAKYSSVGRI
jgi:hypothetical protein